VRTIRWGIIGCGDVCERKSGPALQQARDSALVAVMRRDIAKAQNFALRHGVPRVHATADALIEDPEVDAVYIATPPSSHHALALEVASRGKPCLVEKPMAMNHRETADMVGAFRAAGQPLWVAYYRRALPRFLLVQRLLAEGAIGRLTSIHVRITRPVDDGGVLQDWRIVPAISGAGVFFDLGSHCLDLVDFLAGPISTVGGFSVNTAGAYPAEDATAAAFECGDRVVGTGIWNFNASSKTDVLSLVGATGEITTAVFDDIDVRLTRGNREETFEVRNPPHVHQPLIQLIVDELNGRGEAPSTGESGSRTSWVMDRCVAEYYRRLEA